METQQLQYKLSAFEGPLDLLLTLISKNKIDIYDISISELLDQYMEQINMMQENQMDIASEFLTMASRLVYIKSVMLLPKYEEEAEELKKELSGQLLEYAVCREMAAKLGDIYDFDSFYRDASPVEFDLTYNRIHPSEDIAKAHLKNFVIFKPFAVPEPSHKMDNLTVYRHDFMRHNTRKCVF